MSNNKSAVARKFKLSELSAINSHIENLMVSPLLGIDKSLILHKNKKLLKPILEELEDKIKVIQMQCYKTNSKKELVYTDQGKLIPIEGKITEFRNAYEKLLAEEVEFVFHPINIDELPKSEEFGKVNEVDIYQFIPPLFDIVFFQAKEYNEIKSQIKE